MAQRTVHYLLGERLLNDSVRDCNRFRYGNLLPDAFSNPDDRKITHLIRTGPELRPDGFPVHYCDFESFFETYTDRIQNDDLYLGFYLHLVEDACYRIFWYRHFPQTAGRSREIMEDLHTDYHKLNRYLVEKYRLVCELQPLSDFSGEPILDIYPFDAEKLLSDLLADFSETVTGDPVFLTSALVEEYLLEAEPVCREALERMQTQHRPLPSKSLVW